MITTPMRKAWRDLWRRKLRSIFALLTVALSTAILGTILVSFHYLSRDMNVNFLGANPHNVSVNVSNWQPALLPILRERAEVTAAETRFVRSGRVRNAAGEWQPLILFATEDWRDVTIDRVDRESGVWPPAEGSISIERQALSVLNGAVEEAVAFEFDKVITPDFRIDGLVHDVVQAQAEWENVVYAYATLDTLRAKGLDADVNQLLLTFNGVKTRQEAIERWLPIRSLLIDAGVTFDRAGVPEPGRHPHDAFNQQMYMILKAAGWACSFFASLLLVNLIAISLTSEKRQIGVMKAIGARGGQVAGIYAASVALLGGLATLIGLLLVVPAAWMLADAMSKLLNINLTSPAYPLWMVLALIGMGVFLPLLVALWPIWRASRRSVRESMVDYGLGGSYRPGWLDRTSARFLSAEKALALRNLLRRKGRFALNLFVLTGAGAMMMAAFHFDAVIANYVDSMRRSNQWDLFMLLSEPVEPDRITALAELPEVKAAEAQYRIGGTIEGLPDQPIGVNGLRPATEMFRYAFRSGRWLEHADEVVINETLRDRLPTGSDHLVLTTDLGTHRLRIAGVASIFGGPRLFISDQVFRDAGQTQTNRMLLRCAASFDEAEAAVADATAPLNLEYVTTVAGNIQGLVDHFEIIFKTIVALTVLLSLIALNGIFSSVSMSLLERTREIGILKSLGCSRRGLVRLMILEGTFLGISAWLLGLLLSLPIGKLAANMSGEIFFKAPMAFVVSPLGMLVALAAVPLLSACACLLPARRAARRPIRESLVYE